jgi:hypothetical protein
VVEVDTDTTAGDEADSDPTIQQQQKPGPKGVGRPPPIILTTFVNSMKFQREVRTFIKVAFELRITRNGMKVVTREVTYYSGIMSHLDANKIPYYTFQPKSKPVKVVINSCPGTPLLKITY